MRDVRVRADLVPGLRVKIVQKKDEASGVTTEGVLAEVLTKDEFDPGGLEVRLESGETGRCLRVWEGGAASRVAPPELPSFVPPPRTSPMTAYRLADAEVERALAANLGELSSGDIERMIEHHEEGLTGPALKRFGIRSDELETRTKDLLSGVDGDELERRMQALGFEPTERNEDDEADDAPGDDDGAPPRRGPGYRGRILEPGPEGRPGRRPPRPPAPPAGGRGTPPRRGPGPGPGRRGR